jgi:DNA-binding winged helix-turn-helix (wHTH) protein
VSGVDDLSASFILRFGDFDLDPAAERLLKGGEPVAVQPQPFKLLHLLVSGAGRVVTRDEIRTALWSDDTFVNFDQGVNFAMRQVRDVLGDDADQPQFIQTVPKRGYRFIVPVDAIDRRTGRPFRPVTDGALQKLLWTNIAEMRVEETHRARTYKRLLVLTAVGGAIAGLLAALALLRFLR